ncbi:MAG: aminotransferase class V-fold PLP-dependent enzyme, partial [bacterium]|nr:aminotransferase class V-fold PLP-dependent enzyme [bacterium]
MKKYYLFTPGPTPLPEEVREAGSLPMIHHRTDDFIRIYHRCSEDLKYVFQTDRPVYLLLSSGTGIMETAVINFLSPGDTILVINAGKFGERWSHIARAYGIRVIELKYTWGQGFSIRDIRNALKDHPSIKAVYTQLCETSTGVVMDIKKLGALLKNEKPVFVVDAISGLGAEEFH